MDWAICCLLSFLVGGIPFGYLLGRILLKDDIRNHGSGNIGATNVGRVIGWKWGSLVLLLDAAKGFLPTWAALKWATEHQPDGFAIHFAVLAGISAIVGHMYPIYLNLRGGKGVATALGVVLVLAPKEVGVACLAFILVVATTKLVSLASMAAAVAFSVTYFLLQGRAAWDTPNLSLTAFSILIPALILWRHRTNIVRLVSGSEPTYSEPPEESESP